MRGYLAVTDPAWYERLSRVPEPQDANFWKPSTRRFDRETGMPFLFKRRGESAVVGYGFYAGFSILPDWLAWDTFGEANGVASLDELRARLDRIRAGARIASNPLGLIGCILVAEARFFPRETWVEGPRDWRPRTQSGAAYDLATGEGARVWADCLARSPTAVPEPDVVREPALPRFGAPATYRPRLGQGIFRVRVLDAYERACAVTGEHSLPVLEAAHIQPYAAGGLHAISNGLTLRSDLHRLLDLGYVTVDEGHRLVVGSRLRHDYDNGRSYYGLHGQSLVLPHTAAHRPAPAALAWHRENRFLG